MMKINTIQIITKKFYKICQFFLNIPFLLILLAIGGVFAYNLKPEIFFNPSFFSLLARTLFGPGDEKGEFLTFEREKSSPKFEKLPKNRYL